MSWTAAEDELRWQRLCLKFNNVAHPETCGVCGGYADPELGLEVFVIVEETSRALCHPCQVKYASDLLKARDFYNGAAGPCPWEATPEEIAESAQAVTPPVLPPEGEEGIPF